jgi:hypothetical protein
LPMKAMIHPTPDATPSTRETGDPCSRVYRTCSFWVVLDDRGGAPALPLRVLLPYEVEAMALFSGEEESRMFCHLRGEEGANLRVRESCAGEVLSLLDRSGRSTWCVALDPFHEVPGAGPSTPPTLSRERFARRFAPSGPERVGGLPWR